MEQGLQFHIVAFMPECPVEDTMLEFHDSPPQQWIIITCIYPSTSTDYCTKYSIYMAEPAVRQLPTARQAQSTKFA